MADPKSQQDVQAEGGSVEATEFDSLLRKEFNIVLQPFRAD